jgi:Cu(I)/Ag(I) efflux system membrane fusion protein
MHPQIRRPAAGLCPICAMDLIPVPSGDSGDAGGPRSITLSERARKLADIQTRPVTMQSGASGREIRLPGKVDFDETRIGYITAWVSGRIEEMHINFTGTVVHEGEPMVEIYSPALYTAQEELFQAMAAEADLSDSSTASMKTMVRETVSAVREKLRLLGLSPSQIEEIASRGEPVRTLSIQAPMSGVVIRKDVSEGQYVQTGAPVYTIADLSTVWVMLDAYESDLAWIRLGQRVAFEAAAYPGLTFKGKVTFIHPTIDRETRTTHVHVEVPNPDGRLMPEMLVQGIITAGAGRKTAGPVIPATAPLITGKRAVVYVAVPGEEGTFEGREVVLGPRMGDSYIVRDGLSEGERVVTHGNFKIDSALQIMARPSMMNPEAGGLAPAGMAAAGTGPRERAPGRFLKSLTPLFNDYLSIQRGLSGDSLEKARAGAKKLLQSLQGLDVASLEEDDRGAWIQRQNRLKRHAETLSASGKMEEARTAFQALSDLMIEAAGPFGPGELSTLYRFRCPMAFDNRGADWLQDRDDIENPYFGRMMLKCGEKTEDIAARK